MTETREDAMDAWASKLGDTAKPSTLLSGEETPKPSRTRTRAATTATAKTGNEKLAAQAVEVLVGFNSLLSMGLMTLRMPMTALEISDREDAFREQCYAALLTDPKLCQRIIKMSGTSGTFGLLAAYAMLFVGVLPTAKDESKNITELIGSIKEKRAA